MNKKFLVELCSDLDYEEMVADISYGNIGTAMIRQENGIDNMEIEIFSFSQEVKTEKMPLNDFIKALGTAKKCLLECSKLPDE